MKNNIIFAAALPEPTTGQSASNKFILDKIINKCAVTVIDTSPKSNKKSIKYHLIRLFATINVVSSLSKSPKGSTLYTVYESGIGVIYNYIIVIAARIFNHNIYIHHHTSQHTKAKLLRFSILSVIAKNLTNIALSEEMQRDLKNNYGSKYKSIVIKNHSIISIKNNAASKFHEKNIKIGFISNITIEKGALRSIDCVRNLINHGIKATLIMAGPIINEGTKDFLLKAKKDLGSNLILLGKIAGKEKQDFFDSIDLLIFPTSYKYEAQPLVVLEAMAAGIPIIVSDYGYISEVTPDSSFVCKDIAMFSDFVKQKIEKYIANRSSYEIDRNKCIDHFFATKNISDSEVEKFITEISASPYK